MVAATRETVGHELVGGGDPDAAAAVPTDGDFGEGAFLDASHPRSGWRVSPVVEALILDDREGLGHLTTATFRCLWQRVGGKESGVPVLSRAVRPGRLQRFLADEVDFFLLFAADHCRDGNLTAWQLEALVYSTLCRCDVDPETGKPATRPPEFSGFVREVEKYGWWSADLRGAANAFGQLGLFGPTPIRR